MRILTAANCWGGILILASAVRAQTANQTPASSPGPATTASNAAPPAPSTRAPIKVGNYTFSGSLRTRYENWNWFDTPGFNDSYGFAHSLLRAGLTRSMPHLDVQAEFALPVLIKTLENAVAPAPRGALGLGGNYAAANGGQDASIFPKQLWLRFKGLAGAGSRLRVGRFEFIDGSEVTPKNATLTALKRDRINHRLLGNFGFSLVQRSFDGVQLQLGNATNNFQLLAMRPTEGVFQLNGLGEVDDVQVVYGAYSRSGAKSDARLFALYYGDGRQAPQSVKVDNRSTGARTADREDIAIGTFGGHTKTSRQRHCHRSRLPTQKQRFEAVVSCRLLSLQRRRRRR